MHIHKYIVVLTGISSALATGLHEFHGAGNPSHAGSATSDLSSSRTTSDDLELAVLLTNADQLNAYSRKSDCFRSATGAIRVRCGELELQETERVRAAISMTLCELATANHSPPLECIPFAPRDEASFSSPPHTPHISCVEALSRSAQYWSSYSGYLREVTQLCHAFRRWNDIDTAREAYQNTTRDALLILRHMQHSAERETMLQDKMESTLEHINLAGIHLDTTISRLEHTSTSVDSTVVSMQQQIADAIEGAILTARLHEEEEKRHTLSQFSLAVDGVAERHLGSLATVLGAIEVAMQVQVEQILSRLEGEYDSVRNLSSTVHETWRTVRDDLEYMHDTVAVLTTSARDASDRLEAHVKEARNAESIQRNASHSAVKLAEFLAKLSNNTREEIKKINETAAEVRAEMLADNRAQGSSLWLSWEAWGRHTIMWLLEVCLRVDPAYLEAFVRLPIFRIFPALLQVVCLVFRTSLSSITSVLLVMMSCRRWLPAGDPRTHLSESRSPDPHMPTVVSYPTESESAPFLPVTRRLSVSRSRPTTRSRISRIPDRLLQP